MTSTQDFRYRPDIDALRAFAVLPVVLFHLGASWLPGGFLGVDVFFVISGYLITSLLLRELDSKQTINLWGFWQKRILRILPALLVVVAVTFVVGHVVLYAPDRYMLGINAAGALLSVGNITHWRNYGGYWSGDANDSPLLHTWSLGVEEQFYILYPLALLVAWRLMKQRTSWLLVVGLVLGTSLYFVASQRSPVAAFYLFPARAWELLAGGVAAAANLRHPPAQMTSKAMSFTGLALVLTAYIIGTEQLQVVGALLAVTGAMLVVGSGSPIAFSAMGITLRPLIFVGLISYSIYLWHWPLIILGGAFEARKQIEINPAFYFIASLALGWASWRLIETRIRRTRCRWAAVMLLSTAVVMGGGVYALRGVNNFEPAAHFRAARWDGQRYNVNPVPEWPEKVRLRMQGIEITPRPQELVDVHRRGIAARYGNHAMLDVLVLGDSHGLMWAPAIDAAARELKINVLYMTADGTPVFFDPAKPEATRDGIFFSQSEWSEFNLARLAVIRQQRPRLVLFGSGWRPEATPHTLPLLHEIIAHGSKVIFIEDAPDFAIGDKNAPSYMAYLGVRPASDGRAFTNRVDWGHTAREREAVDALVASCPEACGVVEVRDLYQGPDNGLLILASETPTYIDDDHLSVVGAMFAKSRIQKALATALDEESSQCASRIPKDQSCAHRPSWAARK